jgi:hypothetical protein
MKQFKNIQTGVIVEHCGNVRINEYWFKPPHSLSPVYVPSILIEGSSDWIELTYKEESKKGYARCSNSSGCRGIELSRVYKIISHGLTYLKIDIDGSIGRYEKDRFVLATKEEYDAQSIFKKDYEILSVLANDNKTIFTTGDHEFCIKEYNYKIHSVKRLSDGSRDDV